MTHTFKILAADKLAAEGLAYIEQQPDAELVNKPGLTEDELAAIVGDHDAMIVRSGVQVTAKILENPGRLKVIARAGVGVDNIDLEAATAKGILVMNSAEASTTSTAEHAFTLLMALARNIGPAHQTVAAGGWDRSKFTGAQLSGKSLGVVGFGRIGQTVAARALAFGMTVVAYDPFINAETMLDGKARMFRSFRDLAPHADFLTFHVPLNDQTRGMLNAETFALCRKNVRVINAARGGVVDESAIIPAIESGQCAGVALDVFTEEPPAADSPLRNHPKILTTPHLGASTKEAQQAVSVSAAESALAFLRGDGIRGAVNAGGLRVDLDPMQTCYVDLAGRMAELISPMIDHGVGCVTIQLGGADLASAGGTVERRTLVGLLKNHLDAQLNIINVKHVAEHRGIVTRLTLDEDDRSISPELVIEVQPGDKSNGHVRRIVGRVYGDMRPRITEINGYNMDMIPEGVMVLILNDDRPGMIGMVGSEFGQHDINIADMAISRRDDTAMMVLKVDQSPAPAMMNRLQHRPGIRKVAQVKLPAITTT